MDTNRTAPIAMPGGATGREFTRNQCYKLYRRGDSYVVTNDRLEKRPLPPNGLPAEARQTRTLLQTALDQFSNAQPENMFRAKGSGVFFPVSE